MFLFKQHIFPEDKSVVQAYNHICEFLKISKKIIFTDICEVFMVDNSIFHTSYISEMHKPSYVIVTNLYDLQILKTIRHNHKVILIYSAQSDDNDVIFINNKQDINNIAYILEEMIQ